MANIYKAVRKLSDEDIRILIAIMRCVSVGTALKDTGMATLGKMLGAVSKTLGLQDKNDSTTVSKTIEDINAQIALLNSYSRKELEDLLKKEIILKINSVSDEAVVELVSNERLSFLIVNQAASIYDIDKYMNEGLKIEQIGKLYKHQLMQRILRNYLQAGEQEKNDMNTQFGTLLKTAAIEDVRALQRRAHLAEFSGRGIVMAMQKDTNAKVTEAVYDCLGDSAYDMTRAMVETLYDIAFRFKRIEKAALALFIWKCCCTDVHYVMPSDLMPSYVPGDERIKQSEEEKEFIANLKKTEEIENNIEHCKLVIERLEKKVTQDYVTLLEENQNYKQAKTELERLESDREMYERRVENNADNSEKDLKEYYNNVNKAKKNFDKIDETIKKHTTAISDMRIEIADNKSEIVELNQLLSEPKFKSEQYIAKTSNALQNIWKAYFYRFTFGEGVVRQAVKLLTRSEMLNLELYMKDVHESKDVDAYDRKTGIIVCNVSPGKNVVIKHESHNIISIEVLKNEI